MWILTIILFLAGGGSTVIGDISSTKEECVAKAKYALSVEDPRVVLIKAYCSKAKEV